jgi:hypothetical protein
VLGPDKGITISPIEPGFRQHGVRARITVEAIERPKARWTWVDVSVRLGPDEPWWVTGSFLVDLQDRSSRLRALHIDGYGELSDDNEIDTDLIRRAGVTTRLRDVVDAYLASEDSLLRFAVSASAQVAAHANEPTIGRPREWTDAALAQFASDYADLHKQLRGQGVHAVLAAKYDIAAATSPRLVAKARRAGVLQPTKKGRGGGALTPYGRGLLDKQ